MSDPAPRLIHDLVVRIYKLQLGNPNVKMQQQINQLQDLLIKSGDLSLLFMLARWVGKADLKTIGQAFLQSTDHHMIWTWAELHVPPKEIGPYQDLIIRSRDPQSIYYFAKRVKGANIPRLQKALIETYENPHPGRSPKHTEWLERFWHLPGADVAKIKQVVRSHE